MPACPCLQAKEQLLAERDAELACTQERVEALEKDVGMKARMLAGISQVGARQAGGWVSGWVGGWCSGADRSCLCMALHAQAIPVTHTTTTAACSRAPLLQVAAHGVGEAPAAAPTAAPAGAQAGGRAEGRGRAAAGGGARRGAVPAAGRAGPAKKVSIKVGGGGSCCCLPAYSCVHPMGCCGAGLLPTLCTCPASCAPAPPPLLQEPAADLTADSEGEWSSTDDEREAGEEPNPHHALVPAGNKK
jgi:hypothetical protein